MPDETSERVIARMRPHARGLVLSVVVLWVASFLGMFLQDRIAWEPWNTVVIVLAVVVVALLCVFPYFAWLSRQYTITSRRVTLRSGFGGIRREVLLSRVHDVTLRKRGLQSLFGSGDILISTGGERAIVLADVPNAALVLRALNELLEGSTEDS